MNFFLEKIKKYAQIYPQKVAIFDSNKNYSYSTLYNDSFNLAQRLITYESDNNPVIPIIIALNRGYNSIVSMIAANMVGKPFLYLDPKYPINYLSSLIQLCKSNLVITSNLFKNDIPQNNHTMILDIDEIINNNQHYNDKFKIINAEFSYIIFTSGTTGKPKAAVIKNTGLENLIKYQIAAYPIDLSSRVLQFSPLSFDVAISEIYGCLYAGATLFVINEDIKKDPFLNWQYIKDNKITIFKCTPEVLIHLPQEKNNQLKTIIIGGEVAARKELDFWISNYTVINEYGCTETTVVSTYKIFNSNVELNNIGKPIANNNTYVLDENLNICSYNVSGELYVSGLSLAHGYFNEKNLTEKRFIKNPFYEQDGFIWLYKTGDIVEQDIHGDLKFIGRNDGLLNINGHRVDPNMVSNVINKLPYFKEIVLHLNKEKRNLIAYLVLYSSDELEKHFEINKTTLIDLWTKTFNEFYQKNKKIGLYDSITKQHLTSYEENDWLYHPTRILNEYIPQNILDIGCGNGIILDIIKHDFNSYDGIDISKDAITHCIDKYLVIWGNKVHFSKLKADEMVFSTNKKYDLIIINSVAQYFPNINYLNFILESCLSIINPKGIILVSDIKNFDLLEHYNLSKIISENNVLQQKDRIIEKINENITNDLELAISPKYFDYFCNTHDEIKNYEILAKAGLKSNEYNKFRYDVIIYFSYNNHTHAVEEIIESDEEILQEKMQIIEKTPLLIKNYENFRIKKEIYILNSIHNENFTQLSSLKNELDNEENIFLRKNSSFEVKLLLNNQVSIDKLNILLQPKNSIFHLNYKNFIRNVNDFLPIKQYANDPFQKLFHEVVSIKTKEILSNNLPHYMIPKIFIYVKKFAKNKNGKIDFSSLPHRNKTNKKSNIEIKKITSKENIILDIWKNLFEYENITITDRFFELGGDSITCMLFVTKAREQGLLISYQQVYDTPTLRDIAKKTKYVNEIKVSKKLLFDNKPTPLAPIQKWFFHKIKPFHNYFYQCFILKVNSNINDVFLLKKAILQVINNENIFSLRIYKNHNLQYFQKNDLANLIEIINLDKKDSLQEMVKRQVSILAKKLDIYEGVLIKILIINHQAEIRIIFVLHHIIADGITWRILFDKINNTYRSFIKKTKEVEVFYSSYFEWINDQEKKLFDKNSLKYEINFYKSTVNNLIDHELLAEYELPKYNDITNILFSLQNASNLLLEVPKKYLTQINDILLSALRITFFECFNICQFLIEIEGHGRYQFNNETNINGSLGWHTSIAPLYFNKINEYKNSIEQIVLDTKSTIRNLPRKGIGFNYIRYNYERELNFNLQTPFGFNYLGQFDNLFGEDHIFNSIDQSFSTPDSLINFIDHMHPDNSFPLNLKLTCWYEKKEMHFILSYDKNRYPAEKAITFAHTYLQTLNNIINHCVER